MMMMMMMKRSWSYLSSREMQNPFSGSFGFKNPMMDFLKESHPVLMWLFLPELTHCPFLTIRYARYEERKSKTAKHNIKTKVKIYSEIFECAECRYKTCKVICTDYCWHILEQNCH